MPWNIGALPPSQTNGEDWLERIRDNECGIVKSKVIMLHDLLTESPALNCTNDKEYSLLVDYVRKSILAYCTISGACSVIPRPPSPSSLPEVSKEYKLGGTGSQQVYMTDSALSICYLTTIYVDTYTDHIRCEISQDNGAWLLTLSNGRANTKCHAICFTPANDEISVQSREYMTVTFDEDLFSAAYIAPFTKPGCRSAGRIAGLTVYDKADNAASESDHMNMQRCELAFNSPTDPGYWSMYNHAYTQCSMNCYTHSYSSNALKFYEVMNESKSHGESTATTFMSKQGYGICWLVGERHLPDTKVRKGCHVELSNGVWSVNAYQSDISSEHPNNHLVCRAACLELEP